MSRALLRARPPNLGRCTPSFCKSAFVLLRSHNARAALGRRADASGQAGAPCEACLRLLRILTVPRIGLVAVRQALHAAFCSQHVSILRPALYRLQAWPWS